MEKILEFRTLSKLNGTYVDGMLPLIAEDGRIHAHFQQTVTATGRISCTEPNLQNIPVRQDLGRQLRKVFTSGSEDMVLIGADYSQIELRVLAHMSEDPTLIRAFNGYDPSFEYQNIGGGGLFNFSNGGLFLLDNLGFFFLRTYDKAAFVGGILVLHAWAGYWIVRVRKTPLLAPAALLTLGCIAAMWACCW